MYAVQVTGGCAICNSPRENPPMPLCLFYNPEKALPVPLNRKKIFMIHSKLESEA